MSLGGGDILEEVRRDIPGELGLGEHWVHSGIIKLLQQLLALTPFSKLRRMVGRVAVITYTSYIVSYMTS